MKITIIVLASVFYLLSYSHNSIQVKSSVTSISEVSLHEQIMCSGERFPRCTGSIYCRACKNCKYCKYCNSGGSCGVCGKRPKQHYPPKKKKNPPTSNNHLDYPFPKNQLDNQSNEKGATYFVIEKTSLRTAGSSKAKVIRRLKENEKVMVIESKDKYWWLVSVGENVGWVKKHLLRKKIKLS